MYFALQEIRFNIYVSNTYLKLEHSQQASSQMYLLMKVMFPGRTSLCGQAIKC